MWTNHYAVPIVVLISLSAPKSKSCLSPEATPTSLSAARCAVQPGNPKITVFPVTGDRCFLLCAPSAAKKRKYPSSPETADRCTVALAMTKCD